MAEIRPPLVAEIEELCGLDRHVFGPHCFPSATMRQFLDIAGPLLQVASEDGEVVAYGLILPAAAVGVGWLMALGVRPDRRRRGLGAAVTRTLIKEAARHNIGTLRLTVAPDNVAAISLYKGFEFREVLHVERYFGPGKDRIIMCREGVPAVRTG